MTLLIGNELVKQRHHIAEMNTVVLPQFIGVLAFNFRYHIGQKFMNFPAIIIRKKRSEIFSFDGSNVNTFVVKLGDEIQDAVPDGVHG